MVVPGRCLAVGVLLGLAAAVQGAGPPIGPYAREVSQALSRLSSDRPRERAAAAEALGFLRAREAEPHLIRLLRDPLPQVRREAALALAWCGGRRAVGPLLKTLEDPDWAVAQSAHVALTNLTGMEFAFDALGSPAARAAQAETWRKWWESVPPDRPPKELLEALRAAVSSSTPAPCKVTVSSTYKGPPEVLVDGQDGPGFWQTKNVPFPQWCQLDFDKPVMVGRVVVHQYGRGFCMTDCGVSLSDDGATFVEVYRAKGLSPPKLVIAFKPRLARSVRITSYASERATYPTTFREVQITDGSEPLALEGNKASRLGQERALRALRALGALGGSGAGEAIAAFLRPLRGRTRRLDHAQRVMVQVGLRAMGRLGDRALLPELVAWLDDTTAARYAADALGELGDPAAVPHLLAAYPAFARRVNGKRPRRLPRDDAMRFPDRDRMFHTPYAIAYALARLPLDAKARSALRKLAPLLLANLPQDYDGAVLYEPEVGQVLTSYLLEAAGMRQEACETAFEVLGQPRRLPRPPDAPALPFRDQHQVATWLPALCRAKEDLPRLAALLSHANRWVQLNAAKAIGFAGHKEGIEPVAQALATAPPEASYGYSPRFLDEEYNDPAPRVREALCQALGLLRADGRVELLASIANDERSVLDVRYAACQALARIGSAPALAALRNIAASHPIYTIRQVAREALWLRGLPLPPPPSPPKPPAQPAEEGPFPTEPDAVVFIKGENALPNHFQNDRWRQTYITTDTGPTYRPGRNLFVLRPPRPDGKVLPLTTFRDGYVADIEVSWDGRRVVFARRGGKVPWWHIWQVNADGTGLRQLTDGPYHDVQPAWLPDGRIVFSSSRIGTRDEYHAYLCTALHVMNPDGSGITPLSTNVGRDNEPAILRDGRIVFSRLEVFYSRLKTELTIHAVNPDGTRDMVLYGPERRAFWHHLKVGPRGDDYASNVFPTHRILRLTQPQAMPDGRIVCSTQGGLTLVGPGRLTEAIVPHDLNRAFTTPFPLPDGRLLCASTLKAKSKKKVDLALYIVEPRTGEMTLLYNDPAAADYEPRPLMARARPPVLATAPPSGEFTARFVCVSTKLTREDGVRARGKLVRVIEGVPIVSRHSTQTNPGEVWRNHQGTLARVLGTVPLAPDGSFNLEVPADRLLHFQVLDSDRRVVGNQLTWVYARPGERRTCLGCHEQPDSPPPLAVRPQAAAVEPLRCLPDGAELRYRAKAWLKGRLPPEVEERQRTVRAVNLLAR